MIKYSLACGEGHAFEAWFKDSAAFDTLSSAGQVGCAICGRTDVTKSVMAPAVSGGRPAEEAPLSRPQHPAEQALRKLREHISKTSDYVGDNFATEARSMHVGETEARPIWGEATAKDAKALHDEGVPVAPIPWMTRRND